MNNILCQKPLSLFEIVLNNDPSYRKLQIVNKKVFYFHEHQQKDQFRNLEI